MHFSTCYYSRELDAPPGSAHIRNRSREIHIAEPDCKPAARYSQIGVNTLPVTNVARPVGKVPTGLERWQDEGLYASQFVRPLVWLAVVGIFLAAVNVFFGLFSGVINGSTDGRVTETVRRALTIVTVVTMSWVALGLLCSKVSLRHTVTAQPAQEGMLL